MLEILCFFFKRLNNFTLQTAMANNEPRVYSRRDRTTYNTTFLSKRKILQDSNSNANQPPKKRYKSSPRKSMTKKLLYDFVLYMHDHSELTVEQCRNQPQFVNKIKVQQNTIEKYRSQYKKDSADFKKLQHAVLYKSNSNEICRLPTNPNEVKYGKFPTIEKHVLEKRAERKKCTETNQKPRDTSMRWMTRYVEKLLNDENQIDALNLTEYEREHLHEFPGSEGWCRKVMVCDFYGTL